MDGREAYWDEVADEYDSLYCSEWSAREDATVSRGLSTIWPSGTGVHLDLGAGTGLARRLAPSGLTYVAVDLSLGMLRQQLTGHARVQADVDEGVPVASDRCKAITALYAAGSYFSDATSLFEEVNRLLVPGVGVAYLSFLSGGSIRRRLRAKVGAVEPYPTRYAVAGAEAPPARTYMPVELAEMAQLTGLRTTSMNGLGPLSGVYEKPPLYGLSQWLGGRAPAFSHLIEVSVERPFQGTPDDCP